MAEEIYKHSQPFEESKSRSSAAIIPLQDVWPDTLTCMYTSQHVYIVYIAVLWGLSIYLGESFPVSKRLSLQKDWENKLQTFLVSETFYSPFKTYYILLLQKLYKNCRIHSIAAVFMFLCRIVLTWLCLSSACDRQYSYYGLTRTGKGDNSPR